MHYAALISAAALITNVYSVAVPEPAPQESKIDQIPGMKVIFSDEFQGNAVDEGKWEFWLKEHENNEEQFFSRDDCHVSGGVLKIIPKRTNGIWTSCRLHSKGAWAPNGGAVTYAAKIRLGKPGSGGNMQGVWPAFWAMGESFKPDNKNWPRCGEIDTMENINGEGTLYGTAHCLEGCNDSPGKNQGLGQPTPFDRTQWNVYAHTVTKDSITWMLNGRPYHKITAAQIPGSWAAFQKNFFIILNVAMGGGWPGATAADTVQGAAAGMEVQYVAVYHSV